MAARKLMTALNHNIRQDLGKKLKLSYEESKLDVSAIENLKLVFGTSSTQRVIENAFNILGLEELTKQESIYSFPAYDYMQKLIALEENSDKLNSIYIPRWIIAVTSSFVKSKYSKLEFQSVEQIVNLVIYFVADKTKSLWNTEEIIDG